MADWSGAQAVNFAPADGDRITGALTVNDGVTWTWNAGVDLTETGLYDKTINGRIVADLTLDNPGTLQSSSATPVCDGIGSFVMNAVDSGGKMKGLILYHLQYGIYFNSSYTAHNMDIDNVIFDSCAASVGAYAAACTTTFGNIECRNCILASTSQRLISMEAAQTTTYASVWIHDCFFYNGYIVKQTAGTLNLTEIIVERCSNPISGNSLFLRSSGTPTLNITKIWLFSQSGSSSYIFDGWSASGTLNVDGGIIGSQWGLINPTTAETNVTFDNVDFYMNGRGYVGSGNFNNCYFEANYNNGTAYYEPGLMWQPADTGGIGDDTSSYNTVPFYTCDSITSARATPNYPLTNASDLAVSSVTDDSATFAYTPNCPGETFIYIYDAATTVTNWWDLSDYQGLCIHSHREWQDRSGNNQKIHQLTSRSRTITDYFKAGKTYKARVATKVPWGHTNGHGLYWGSEQSFSTDAGAGGGMLVHAGMTGGVRG